MSEEEHMRSVIAFALTTTLLVVSSPAFGVPKLQEGTRASGVVAFQDDSIADQFYLYPEHVPLVLGLTLTCIDFGRPTQQGNLGGCQSHFKEPANRFMPQVMEMQAFNSCPFQ